MFCFQNYMEISSRIPGSTIVLHSSRYFKSTNTRLFMENIDLSKFLWLVKFRVIFSKSALFLNKNTSNQLDVLVFLRN